MFVEYQMPSTDTTAHDVATYLLDETGRSLLSGDFESYAECFTLPWTVDTFEGGRVVRTRQDLRDVFDAVRAHFRPLNVTDLARNVVEATFCGPDTITVTYSARLVSGSFLQRPAFSGMWTLRREECRWRIGRGQYAFQGDAGFFEALMGKTPGRDARNGAADGC